jgi:hypothetical protein
MTVLYTDTSCQNNTASLPDGGECIQVSGVQSAMTMTSPSGSPSCLADGGQATGSVVATPGATICCPM